MDEAKRVIDRLRRIDELRTAGAQPDALLDELRGLLRDGAAWAAAEGVGTNDAQRALAELQEALAAADTDADGRHESVLRKGVGTGTTAV